MLTYSIEEAKDKYCCTHINHGCAADMCMAWVPERIVDKDAPPANCSPWNTPPTPTKLTGRGWCGLIRS